MRKLLSLSALLAVALLFTACDSDRETVVDILTGRDDTSTLVTAVVAAGLVETLDGDGPFTVFAPNNAAFAALPAGTVEALLADPAALTNILTFHVVAGDLKAADVVAVDQLTSVQGSPLDITVTDAGVMIENANIIEVDLGADNGTVHIIDAVMLP